MTKSKAIEVLNALADGCSPLTGERIEESVLNERQVIRALQIAIETLKKSPDDFTPLIPATEINQVITLFKENDKMPTASRISKFFLGNKPFKRVNLSSSVFYKKYQNLFQEEELTKDLNDYIIANKINKKDRPWDGVNFFDGKVFNVLLPESVNELYEKINGIEILKVKNLPNNIINARKNHPRAYENWSDEEVELFSQALKKTNDLVLLSKCFQRGEEGIISLGKKIIYQQKNKQD